MLSWLSGLPRRFCAAKALWDNFRAPAKIAWRVLWEEERQAYQVMRQTKRAADQTALPRRGGLFAICELGNAPLFGAFSDRSAGSTARDGVGRGRSPTEGLLIPCTIRKESSLPRKARNPRPPFRLSAPQKAQTHGRPPRPLPRPPRALPPAPRSPAPARPALSRARPRSPAPARPAPAPRPLRDRPPSDRPIARSPPKKSKKKSRHACPLFFFTKPQLFSIQARALDLQ